MKKVIFISLAVLALIVAVNKNQTDKIPIVQDSAVVDSSQATFNDINDLALSNGFKPSKRIVNAILNASDMYKVDALELTAVGIVETGLGKYAKIRHNTNGTIDRGIFQINTINETKCVEYNLDSPEGSSLCAAKLLSQIKAHRRDYLGVYHSKTPAKKHAYMRKISQVLALGDDK